MEHFRLLIICAILLLAVPVAAGADGHGAELPLGSLAVTVSATEALISAQGTPVDYIHPDGCLVWQQPGVAIVPDVIWRGDSDLERIHVDAGGLKGLLACLPGYSWEEPFIFPREEEYNEDDPPGPAVFLLDGEAAQRRLTRYYDGYMAWVGYNSPDGDPDSAGMRTVPEDSLQDVVFAVVYIADGEAISFLYSVGDDGRPLLRHLIIHPFFSA